MPRDTGMVGKVVQTGTEKEERNPIVSWRNGNEMGEIIRLWHSVLLISFHTHKIGITINSWESTASNLEWPSVNRIDDPFTD